MSEIMRLIIWSYLEIFSLIGLRGLRGINSKNGVSSIVSVIFYYGIIMDMFFYYFKIGQKTDFEISFSEKLEKNRVFFYG